VQVLTVARKTSVCGWQNMVWFWLCLFFETRRSKPCNFIARIYYAFFSLSEKNNQANFIRVPFSNLCTSSAESFSYITLMGVYLLTKLPAFDILSETLVNDLADW